MTTPNFRRIETGFAADGREVIVSDSAAPRTVVAPSGVAVSELLWLDGPPRSPADGGDRVEPATGFPLEPPPGGASFRILHLPAPPAGAAIDDTWLRVPGDHPDRPGMHATDTLDYVVVLAGRIVLGLDDGDHELGPGDVVIQRGTAHRWRVSGTEPCTYAVLMLRPDRSASGASMPLVAAAVRDGDAGGRVQRLVTASDADGRSFVQARGTPALVFEPSGPDGVSIVDLWQTGGPLQHPEQGGDAPAWALDPLGDGISCRTSQLPAGLEVGDRGWHATPTIDLNVVLHGQVELALPGGVTTVVHPGETVLQRGTNHQWRPVGESAVRWFAVMIAAG